MPHTKRAKTIGFRRPVRRGGVGCRTPETAGIDFYSGFRKNGQGGRGVQIEILKNPGIDFYSGFRKNYQRGGCKSKS